MAVIGRDLTQVEPVKFRVRDLTINPLDQARVLLSIELLNHHNSRNVNFDLWPHVLSQYREDIWEAIRSQAVYWVDWSREEPRPFPRRQNDALDDRVLLAIKNRQVLPAAVEVE